MARTPPGDALWISRPNAAALVELGPRQFDEAIRPRLSASDFRGEGRSLRYHAPAVVRTFVAYKLEHHAARHQAIGAKDTQGPDALIEVDNALDSEGLERLRLARAEMAELDLAERRAQLVRREDLDPALAGFASNLRRAGETLQQQFGAAAAELFNRAIDRAEEGVEVLLAGVDEEEDDESAGK